MCEKFIFLQLFYNDARLFKIQQKINLTIAIIEIENDFNELLNFYSFEFNIIYFLF